MTPQEIVNKVYFALKKQGKPSVDKNGECLYRGPNGLKCAAGHLMSDKEYDSLMEGYDVNYSGGLFHFPEVISENAKLIKDLQDAHDMAASQDENFWDEFSYRLIHVLNKFDLEHPESK